MGSFIRLPAKDINSRIDAGYYGPKYVANAKRLLDSSLERAELSSFVSGGRRTLYFGTSTLEEEQAPEGWVSFLTSDDLGEDGFFIETRARRRVPPAFLDDYPAGRLRSGELLVKVKGPNQTTAYIETVPDYPVLVSGTIWGGLVRKDIVDPHYLVAALSCPYAVMARTRLRTNLNVEFLSAEDLLSLALPKPARLAQCYIGDKVRQAERLRERASAVHANLQVAASAFFGGYKPTPKSRSYRTGPLAIAGRVDAWFYNPRFVHAAKAIEGAGIHLTELEKLAPGITNGGTPRGAVFGADGVRWIRGKDFVHGDIDLAKVPLLDRTSEQTIARSRTKRGDLLLSIKGTVGDVAVIDSEIEGCNINQDIARIPLGSETEAQFLALFLESELGQVLMERQVYGAINAFLSLENLRELVVPDIREVPSSVREKLASMRAQIVALRRASAVLIGASKLLVEHLIDAQIAEADLVAAQKALEAGSRTGDRAILQALRKTDTTDAKPLIPDLDAFFTLLDEQDGDKD